MSISVRGREVHIPEGKQQALLAALLVHANKVVSPDDLVGYLWDDERPQNPSATLQTYVARLRATFRKAGLAKGRLRRSSGYAFEAGVEELDLLDFRAMTRHAEQARRSGDLEAESKWLRGALELWDWPVLSEVPSERLQREVVPGLVEEWIRVSERHSELELALGRHRDVIAELRWLTAQHPHHEGLQRNLMLALYRSGRQAEALEVYHETAARLRSELGIDPSDDLNSVQVAILQHDPGLHGRGG